MTVQYDASNRGWSQGSTHGAVCLQDKYEVLREIGDGSFGSVAQARVRSGGAHVARRGTLVAIKTMKKTFDSFAPCLELREIIFMRSLPAHHHIVPALDIFLDPLSKKLHVAMENMDGNLYQLMKARDHKPFDGHSVKSILFQIMSGLEHIHDNGFFHRDIKPENILVSVSSREDISSAVKRYSQLGTPPSTPPSYSIKLADFGLARETNSKLPYTTYVSTRWYRAPEVLLRAGEYSAPVDIWAVGAMAVEVATLKPLFPGGNEVDQVWRVCEIMGSPGNWVNKQGIRVGGGEWKDGIKLAQKLGFSFPKMAPHTLDTVLQPPQWPPSLSLFITWCLMWDPKTRPTSTQALKHEYFTDAHDPLRPKSSGSKLLSRKHPDSNNVAGADGQTLSSKTSSWFRRSLIARESAPAVPQVTEHNQNAQPVSPQQSTVRLEAPPIQINPETSRPAPNKRSTWTNGSYANGAPMPILPSIRPVSPLSNAVTAQAHAGAEQRQKPTPKKIGRQLSLASQDNHYSDTHRQEAERALNGQGGLTSPSGQQKESFFSHLRKRARRLSGRTQLPMSPREEPTEPNAGCAPWGNNRNSMTEVMANSHQPANQSFTDLDRALQNVRYSLDAAANQPTVAAGPTQPHPAKVTSRVASNPMLKRHHSMSQTQAQAQAQAQAQIQAQGQGRNSSSPTLGLSHSRSIRRVAQRPTLHANQYETPDEQEELLDEALTSARNAAAHLDRQQRDSMDQRSSQVLHEQTRSGLRQRDMTLPAPYPTPSPSAKRNSVTFGNPADPHTPSKPIDIQQSKYQTSATAYPWPTPPNDDNEWAAAAAASIAAAGDHYR